MLEEEMQVEYKLQQIQMGLKRRRTQHLLLEVELEVFHRVQMRVELEEQILVEELEEE
jgi:hypothetical protein